MLTASFHTAWKSSICREIENAKYKLFVGLLRRKKKNSFTHAHENLALQESCPSCPYVFSVSADACAPKNFDSHRRAPRSERKLLVPSPNEVKVKVAEVPIPIRQFASKNSQRKLMAVADRRSLTRHSAILLDCWRLSPRACKPLIVIRIHGDERCEGWRTDLRGA